MSNNAVLMDQKTSQFSKQHKQHFTGIVLPVNCCYSFIDIASKQRNTGILLTTKHWNYSTCFRPRCHLRNFCYTNWTYEGANVSLNFVHLTQMYRSVYTTSEHKVLGLTFTFSELLLTLAAHKIKTLLLVLLTLTRFPLRWLASQCILAARQGGCSKKEDSKIQIIVLAAYLSTLQK